MPVGPFAVKVCEITIELEAATNLPYPYLHHVRKHIEPLVLGRNGEGSSGNRLRLQGP